uniref:C2 domain-containing protein n=1 Tax=Branchiostoma floridae TaxID=7739 RepID=C3ZD86_BRAFL|eukprot:XP_002593430.1 hypothetical protein BRAFLDRAFT_70790 [Branchiostoma floridae]
MGVRDRIASAYLTVVSALSVLRPGGGGEAKLSIVVHEGKVGRHSQAKYLVTIRHGKEKKHTKKRKSDGLLWDHVAEFSHWTPKDPLILKLRKAKRCKDATIAKLSIDVAAALESVDGLPNRWWYAIERLDKSGRQKEEVFLQITVTVDGRQMKKDPAKPTEKPASTAAQTTPELKASSPPPASTTGPAASQPVVASDEANKSSRSAKREDKASHERRSSVSQEGEVGSGRSDISPSCAAGDVKPASSIPPSSPPASFDTPDKAGTSGHGEGDVKAGPECHDFRDKDGEISEVLVPTAVDYTGNTDSGRGHQGPAKSAPFKETALAAAPELPVSDIHQAGQKEAVTVSTDVDNDSGQAESATTKEEQEVPKPRMDPKDALTEMYLKNLKRILAQRDFPQHLVSRYAWMIEGLSKDTEMDRPANSDTNTDGPGEVASSTQGGGVALTPANPRNKNTDDPEFEKMMHVWSIEDLLDKFTKMRKSADELLAYAESLLTKLSAAVPHVLDYPLIKNLLAHVPESTSYDFPDTEGLSLQDLEVIEDNLAKLLKEEKNRATYLRERFIDELCSVAMNEAPQVLSKED